TSLQIFVMLSSFPYSAMQMTADEVETMLNILHQLQHRHHASFKMDLEFSFKSFSLFQNYVNVEMGPVIDLSGENQIYLGFPHLSYIRPSASRHYVPPTWEYQSWGI